MLDSVGRYSLIERIGEGAMADVYRAFDPRINRQLAIKVLKQELGQDTQYATRFLQEAKAAGLLSHPNIVTIYDVGEANGLPFIVMELLDGQPLDAVMLEHKKLKIEDILTYGIQIAQALDYAHAMGVVHRDIKPSNIILSKDNVSAKLLDFGIARVGMGDQGPDSASRAMTGTPRYMSPEQALGENIDGRSDLYALGVVLYELLTGRKAFSAVSMASLIIQITQQDPDPISQYAPEVPHGLQFIISKLLSKRPDRRFRTGAEVAFAFQRELDALITQRTEAKRHRYLPLPIKVTILMTTIIALVMSVSIFFTLDRQAKVMQNLAMNSGASIANFIASNTGTYMALEDWDNVSVFVKVSAENEVIEDMIVTDAKRIIRGAKEAQLENQSYRGKPGKFLAKLGDVYIEETKNDKTKHIFRFSRPVIYAGKNLGMVYVSLKEDELTAAAEISQVLLILLGIITLLSVSIVAFTVAFTLAQPIKRLKNAMQDVARGNLNFRISHTRHDEFGEAFNEFNHMAYAIQDRLESALGFIKEPPRMPPPLPSAHTADAPTDSKTPIPPPTL